MELCELCKILSSTKISLSKGQSSGIQERKSKTNGIQRGRRNSELWQISCGAELAKDQSSSIRLASEQNIIIQIKCSNWLKNDDAYAKSFPVMRLSLVSSSSPFDFFHCWRKGARNSEAKVFRNCLQHWRIFLQKNGRICFQSFIAAPFQWNFSHLDMPQ